MTEVEFFGTVEEAMARLGEARKAADARAAPAPGRSAPADDPAIAVRHFDSRRTRYPPTAHGSAAERHCRSSRQRLGSAS